MKNTHKIVLGMCMAFSTMAFAQNSAVVSAYNYLNDYNRDRAKEPESLLKAKESIDKASESESTSGKPKTWFYRGNVYMALSESKHESHSNFTSDALKNALDSYVKCYKLDPKGEFAEDAKLNALRLSNNVFNSGVNAFNVNKDYKKAGNEFETSFKIKNEFGIFDTTSLIYSGMSSFNDKNFEKAIETYNVLIAKGNKGGANNYIYLGKSYLNLGKEQEAIKTFQEGRSKFPDDFTLITEELNIYLSKGRDNDAKEIIELAIQKDPKNHLLYFASGVTYDRLGNKIEAEKAYQKAIEIKSDYFDAYYNLGALYNNSAKDLIDNANNEKDLKKSDMLKKEADSYFNKAIPILEKAHELDKNDVNTMISLKALYGRVGNNDKFLEMKKKLEP